MGKKIRSEMEAQREIFMRGATDAASTRRRPSEVFDLMAKFADYGFNKSHAAAYALVAYQTAWMKANHPAAFLAACMSLAIGNTDRLAALRQEAERAGHPHPAAGHQPLGRRLHAWNAAGRRRAGDPLRAGRGQEGRCWRRCSAVVAARGDKAVRRPRGFRRARRSAPAQPHADREPGRAPAPSTGWSATAPGCSPRRTPSCAARRRWPRKRDSGQIGLFGGSGGRRKRCALPRYAGLAADGAAGLRGGGDRLSPHRASAGRLCPALRRLGVMPMRPGRGRAQAGATRVKLAGSVVATEGARHPHRQPDGLGAPVRRRPARAR